MVEGERRLTEVLKQQDGQTCLICCLLMNYSHLTKEAIDSRRTEEELHHSAFGLYPEYPPLSQLAAFIRGFEGIEAKMLIDSPEFARYLHKLNREKTIKIVQQEINPQWVMTQLQATGQSVLVFIDYFYLGYPAHTPHWLEVLSCQEGSFEVADSGVGSLRSISKKMLGDSIGGLKYVMLWSPAAIILGKAS